MKRKLIYADELEEKLLKMGFHPALVRGMLENMKPVDAVEVVRCEECINYNGHRYCNYSEMSVLDNDFCSYGERRVDNE